MGLSRTEKQARPYFVYRLRCPLTHLVRYIGISHDPYQRQAAHRTELSSQHGKRQWILKLRKHGLTPILEVVSPELHYDEARAWEMRLQFLYGVMYPRQLCCAPVTLYRKTTSHFVLGPVWRERRKPAKTRKLSAPKKFSG